MEELHNRMRIIQEIVPGKQLTLMHIIANPDETLYQKMNITKSNTKNSAIGIITVTPAETAIILGDISLKSSGVCLECVDRVSGSLIFTGSVSEVEAALNSISEYAQQKLNFEVCPITKT